MGETIATNKKAFQNYFLTDKWEAGLVLNGGEVKSIRDGNVNFTDSFARIDAGEVWLFNLHINPYKAASYMNEDPDRKRKLLLNKKEIKKIYGRLTGKGVTLVPTKMYFNNRGFVKVEIALGQGKKLYDKRADIKERDIKRELSRATKVRKK